MNESQLIERLRQKDEKAYEELYLLYNDLIYSVIDKIIKVAEDSEELTQDVFVKVFKKINQFRGDSKLSTWLTSIARNTALNFLESIKKEKEAVDQNVDIDDDHNWISDISNPEEIIIMEDGKKMLHKAIAILPENQRTAFSLFYLDGLKQLDISDIMGVSVDAVESLIYRAKTRFRLEYENKTKKNLII
ncbi:MAG: sigma-70 family RNA polymerase sigma factor [Chitinophagales bacterium]